MDKPKSYAGLLAGVGRYWGRCTIADRTGISKTDQYMLLSGQMKEPRTSGQRVAVHQAWKELYWDE
jgi:hypothetical protein